MPPDPDPNHPAFSADDMLSTAQVADRTFTCISTWAKRRLRGDGPRYLKIGRSVRYRWGDVEHWLHAHRYWNTSQYPACGEEQAP
ncbi:helix-turn-helix transcriptional regulator [Maricaulis sp.]|uniref:helix-turn-helix transcriptional regulator n=1 Tax=Maricaulis sp. TaxID=1486257 RepID=UPI003A93E5D4